MITSNREFNWYLFWQFISQRYIPQSISDTVFICRKWLFWPAADYAW